jgi:nucleotide-binding universal stress UspA family protein
MPWYRPNSMKGGDRMSSVILVPLDGSLLAERALPYAERLARAGSRRLVLVRAVELFLPDGEACIESEHPMLAEAQKYLEDLAKGLMSSGLQVGCTVPYGSPSEQILASIHSYHPDFVVMGTHARSGFGRWLHGSVADAVLCHSSSPVVLVPSHLTEPAASIRGARLLVPLDGSPLSEAVLPWVARVATETGAEVVLARVVPFQDSLYPGYIQVVPPADVEQLNEARAYLSAVAEQLMATALPVRTRAEVGADPGTTIARLADEECADMIVMGTHGRSGVVRFVLGSVANGTLRHARVPLLLIRPSMLAVAPIIRSAPPACGAAQSVARSPAASGNQG